MVLSTSSVSRHSSGAPTQQRRLRSGRAARPMAMGGPSFRATSTMDDNLLCRADPLVALPSYVIGNKTNRPTELAELRPPLSSSSANVCRSVARSETPISNSNLGIVFIRPQPAAAGAHCPASRGRGRLQLHCKQPCYRLLLRPRPPKSCSDNFPRRKQTITRAPRPLIRRAF